MTMSWQLLYIAPEKKYKCIINQSDTTVNPQMTDYMVPFICLKLHHEVLGYWYADNNSDVSHNPVLTNSGVLNYGSYYVHLLW